MRTLYITNEQMEKSIAMFKTRVKTLNDLAQEVSAFWCGPWEDTHLVVLPRPSTNHAVYGGEVFVGA